MQRLGILLNSEIMHQNYTYIDELFKIMLKNEGFCVLHKMSMTHIFFYIPYNNLFKFNVILLFN